MDQKLKVLVSGTGFAGQGVIYEFDFSRENQPGFPTKVRLNALFITLV